VLGRLRAEGQRNDRIVEEVQEVTPHQNHIPIQNSQTPELLAKYLRHIGQGDLLTHQEKISLSNAADELGICRERIRQIQREAVQTLKRGRYARALRGAVA
jgi:hypothetical protein